MIAGSVYLVRDGRVARVRPNIAASKLSERPKSISGACTRYA
jgi:hypothetical protein